MLSCLLDLYCESGRNLREVRPDFLFSPGGRQPPGMDLVVAWSVGLGLCLGLHIQFWRLYPVLVVLQPVVG